MKAMMILVVALMGSFTVSYAGSGEKAFKKFLERKIFYPLSVSTQQEEVLVTVSICVSEVGEMFVSSVVSDNQEINESIRKQVEKLQAKITPDMYGKTYQYKFKLVQE